MEEQIRRQQAELEFLKYRRAKILFEATGSEYSKGEVDLRLMTLRKLRALALEAANRQKPLQLSEGRARVG